MSLIFPGFQKDVSALLDEAYENACDQLIEDHKITASQLALLIEPVTAAIMDLYNAGQRSDVLLANYAVSRAMAYSRKSGQWLFDE